MYIVLDSVKFSDDQKHYSNTSSDQFHTGRWKAKVAVAAAAVVMVVVVVVLVLLLLLPLLLPLLLRLLLLLFDDSKIATFMFTVLCEVSEFSSHSTCLRTSISRHSTAYVSTQMVNARMKPKDPEKWGRSFAETSHIAHPEANARLKSRGKNVRSYDAP